MTLNPFYGTRVLQYPLKTSGNLWFFEVFQEVQKNTSAMKQVKDIVNKYVSRMLVSLLIPQQRMFSYSRSALVLSMNSRGIKFQCFLIKINFKEHLSVTASGVCSWQPIETITFFYYSMYFKGKQSKQTCFIIPYTLN